MLWRKFMVSSSLWTSRIMDALRPRWYSLKKLNSSGHILMRNLFWVIVAKNGFHWVRDGEQIVDDWILSRFLPAQKGIFLYKWSAWPRYNQELAKGVERWCREQQSILFCLHVDGRRHLWMRWRKYFLPTKHPLIHTAFETRSLYWRPYVLPL